MFKNIVLIIAFIGGITLLSSCGTKKPQEKVDYTKVDKAYNDFNNGNN